MEKLTKSKKLKRQRKHGFLGKAKTHKGKNQLKRRRKANRKSLTV